MSLKLVETTLNNVPDELRSYYVKKTNGNYVLNVDVEEHVAPLKSSLSKLKLESALKNANVRQNHADMLLRRLSDRVAIDTKDGESVVRILPAKNEMFSASDGGPDGATTLEELIAATVKEFPFLFGDGADVNAGEKPAGQEKTIAQSEWKKLSALEQRRKIVDENYKIVDDPRPPARQPRPGVKEMARTDFDALGPVERARKMSDGWTLFD